jgi:uncharacterized protein YicC (UPF0701 family)
MVCSMTGYATVARELAQGTLTLELRSVNGRYLDVQFRMAEELRAVEPALRELVTGAVARGKVDCRINFAAAPLARADVELAAEVLARLARLSRAVRAAIPDAQTCCTGPASWATRRRAPRRCARPRSRRCAPPSTSSGPRARARASASLR